MKRNSIKNNNTKIITKNNTRKNNNGILKLTSLVLIFTLVFQIGLNISFITKTYAIEKPNYADWLRDLYEYSEEISDEEIVKEKGFEDEVGRVFFKNPATLTYDLWSGNEQVISVISGIGVVNGGGSFTIDLSNIEYRQNGSEIINYYQTDYQDPYSGSTIARAGCGPSSCAMVIASLTNQNVTPVDLANWATINGYAAYGQGSYWSLMSDAPAAYGLNVHGIQRNDAQGLANALSAGHPVEMICGPGEFTGGGHFIVLTGIDENGMVTVNDPNSVKRSNTKYSLQTIMQNAATTCGNSAVTYWEVSAPEK